MEVYRDNWITPRDFKIIKSFGFNTIRLPFNYRLLQDDEKPFELKKDAFKWLDRAIEMAEAEGIYVILDMHGVPAGRASTTRPVASSRTSSGTTRSMASGPHGSGRKSPNATAAVNPSPATT